MDNHQVGQIGEGLAAELLQQHGYQILDRNWRPTSGLQRQSGERQNRGELDIVALNGKTLVGVEVKTRTTENYGTPAAAIDPRKIARLRGLVGQWLAEHRNNLPQIREIRLDAVAVTLQPLAAPGPEIVLYQGVC